MSKEYITCKIHGCNNEMKYPKTQACYKHYVRFYNTGSYDQPGSDMLFDGSTHKVPEGGKSGGTCPAIDKFIIDRNADIYKRVEGLRADYKERGLRKSTLFIARELVNEIDITPNYIAKIVNRINREIAAAKESEWLNIARNKKVIDYRTSVW